MMNKSASDGLEVETFFSSKNSPLGKSRIYTWIGLAVGIMPVINMQSGRDETLHLPVFLLVFFVGLGLLMEWLVRKQLRLGQPLVTLTDEFVEAPNLTGKAKRILWTDIERISLDAIQGTRMLSFLLKASSGVPNKRSFLSGVNPGKPALALSPFSVEDQERLLDAANLRHAKASGYMSEGQSAISNDLKEEREFQEKLKALQPHAWVTYAIIGINVLIWLVALTQGATIISTPADKLFAWGGNAASEVQKGEWWRMLSATFLHSGFLHVAMNMLGLYAAGVVVERIYGSRLFLIIYLGSGLLGSALSLHFSAQQAVSVGASGAVFGVTGALLVAVFQHRDKLPKVFSKQTMSGIGFFVLYSLMQGLGKNGIDNAAHIGGLVGGCLVAFVLPERFDMTNFQHSLAKRAVAAIVILGAATLSLAAMAPPAAIDQARIFARNEIIALAFRQFDQGVKVLQQEQKDIKTGKISEREVDERSRAVHAPVFRNIANELSQVVLLPKDPRESFLRDVQRMSELLSESLSMESVFSEESRKYEPVNPKRAAEIEAELSKINERVMKYANSAKKV
jgi:rhomboid protease GluP